MALLCTCKTKFQIYNNFWQEYFEIKEIINLKKKLIKCKTINQFINIIIEFIKDKIIRKFYCLKKFNIKISGINNNNIYHQIILSLSEIIRKKLKIKEKEKINYNKSLFIIIWYENNLVFMTNICFDGII
jgi:hypothetical protein